MVYPPQGLIKDIKSVPAKYVILREGGKVVAYNCETGTRDYVGDDPAYVINNAINSLTAGRTWKEKIVIKGDYVINSPVLPKSYTVVEIQGKIKVADSAYITPIFIQNAQHVDIIGGEIDGNKDNNPRPYPGGVDNLMGIWVADRCRDIRIIGTHVHDVGDLGITVFQPVDVRDPANYSEDILIAYNVVHDSRRDCIALDDWNRGVTIIGNLLYNAVNYAIGIARGCNRINIAGNVCRDSQYGILIGTAETDPLYFLHNINIVGNTVYSNSWYDIYIAKASNCTVVGNIVYSRDDITYDSVRISSDVENILLANNIVRYSIRLINAKNCVVTGNSVYAKLTALSANNSSDIVVSSNNIISEKQGIYASGNSRLFVHGNRITAGFVESYQGIVLTNTVNSAIRNNIVMSKPDSAIKMNYGIQESSGCDYNIITDNIIIDAGIKSVLKTGANTVVKRNTGYPTESYGTATIPAGQTSVTVNHGLVGVPNKIIVSPRENIQVWVSSVTSTSFTITCSTAPSVDVIVDWEAEI